MFARPIYQAIPRLRPRQICPRVLSASLTTSPAPRHTSLWSSPRARPQTPRSPLPWSLSRWTSTAAGPSPARDPLHILFCGSDDFSCASLQALYDEMRAAPASIASIQVLVRPAKRTGRGLKTTAPSPVKALATQLSLRVHEQDTFTGWSPPDDEGRTINMVVAVSFGLFVPPRILRRCAYGGLNVHPSLLPDLHGASPIEHAILLGRAATGVTVQTLHERTFDGGRRLLAAPRADGDGDGADDNASPRVFAIDGSTTAQQLRHRLAPVGARLLVEVIQRGLFLTSFDSASEASETAEQGTSAPKLSKADREVQFTGPWASAVAVDRQLRALGPVWTHVKGKIKRKMVTKRAIFDDVALGAFPRRLDSKGFSGMDTLTFVHDGRDVVLPVLIDGPDVVLPLGTLASSSSSSRSSIRGGWAEVDRQGALRLRRVKIEGYDSDTAAKSLGGFVRRQLASDVAWDVVFR